MGGRGRLCWNADSRSKKALLQICAFLLAGVYGLYTVATGTDEPCSKASKYFFCFSAIVGAMERDNYDEPSVAFLTVLGILTTSNWNRSCTNCHGLDFRASFLHFCPLPE